MLIRKDLPLKHVTIKAFWHCQSSFARSLILAILICILMPGVYLQPTPALEFAQVTSSRLSACPRDLVGMSLLLRNCGNGINE